MSEEAAAVALPLHRRFGAGLRRPANWWQLIRFGLVGASGYVVNLLVFTVALHLAGIGRQGAAVLAFLIAVTNNFALNRHWTFAAREGHAGFQASRFFVVSVAAFLVSLGILEALVVWGGLPEVAAQALAVVCATPLNFIGNKLWSFRGW